MNRSYLAWLLMGSFSIFLMYLGRSIADRQGLLLAFIIALVLNSLVYFYGDIRIKKLFRSKKVEGQDPYRLEEITKQLCCKMHIPIPELFICELSTPTAFSTGHNTNSAAIVLSKSLLEKLDHDELKAVLAFELSKIQTHFSFSASICSAIAAGSIGIAERLDKLLFFGKNFKEELGPITGLICPLVTWLIRVVQSKNAFFDLDKKASQITGEPKALAKSLWKLESLVSTQPEMVPKDTAHIFFINPLPKYGWSKMFQTQPTAKERIEKLIGQYPI